MIRSPYIRGQTCPDRKPPSWVIPDRTVFDPKVLVQSQYKLRLYVEPFASTDSLRVVGIYVPDLSIDHPHIRA